MKNLPVLICTAFIYLSAHSMSCQASTAPELSALEAQMSVFKEELGLSAEQEAELRDIMSSGAEQREQVLKKYGISMDDDKKAQLNFREKRALMGEMKKTKNQLDERLRALLSDEQMVALKALQEESQQAFRDKMRNKLR